MGEWIDSATGRPNRDKEYASAQVIEIPSYYQAIGSPWNLIQNQFETTSAYASDSYEASQGFIEDIGKMISQLEYFYIPKINVDAPEVPGIDYQSRPKMGSLPLNENWPANTSEKPSLTSLPDINEINFPTFSIADPILNMPDRPEEKELHGPGDPPFVNDVLIPGKPDLDLPKVPILQEFKVPDAPVGLIPTFDSTLMDEIFSVPAGMNWAESPYNSEIWQGLLTKVVEGIEHGGEALAPEIEAAIWERALLDTQVTDQAAYEEIENYWSTKGWDIPQGSLAAALQEKNDEIQRNRRKSRLDIAIKQAELADGNTKFIMQLGKDSEMFLRDFHNNQMNRKLEAEKAVASNAIEILKAHILQYNAKIEKYKADASVYGEKVRASLAQVEIFKAQVEGVKVSSEVQKNLVDLYTAQVEAVEIFTKIYVAELQGADISSKIEARKLEMFKMRVDSYVAEIGGEKAKYEMYGIATEAEKVNVEIFSERVKAFLATVEIPKAQLELEVAQLDAKAKSNDHELGRYKAELSAYAIELDAAAKKIGAVVEAYKGEVSAYNAETGAESSKYEAIAKSIQLKIEEARFNMELGKAEIDSKTDGYIALKKLQMDGLNGVTSVSAQLSASAMNAVNASTSFGYSSGESMSTSFNYGASSSENHSFSHPTRQLS